MNVAFTRQMMTRILIATVLVLHDNRHKSITTKWNDPMYVSSPQLLQPNDLNCINGTLTWLSNQSTSDFDDEDTSSLPFPEPLSRASFLAPDFDPAQYLSSLRNRHQSLEDLRQELRDLDQLLSKELLDLVNENYQEFLSLGNALHGGEEKAEEVRVGLLAFQRDVTTIRENVEGRRREVEWLLGEKKRLRKDANIGQVLLDIADRVEELEHRLMIGEGKHGGRNFRQQSSTGQNQRGEQSSSGTAAADLDGSSDGRSDESDEDEDEDDDGEVGVPEGTPATPAVSLKRIERHIQKYVAVMKLSERIGRDHPFLVNQQPRMNRIRSAVLIDLKTALEQTKNSGEKHNAKTLAVLRLYNLMGEDPSAITALKNLKL